MSARIFKPLQVGFAERIFEQNNAFYCIASATLGVDLLSGRPLLEPDFLKSAFQCMGARPLPDPGMPKPCGEYMVSGSYHAPQGLPVTGGEVKVRLGEQSKNLFVFGPRNWVGGSSTRPESIVSLPVDYEQAFGGKGYAKNPDGRGYKDGRLPCVESPAGMVTSRTDTPEPAGFGPLDPSWPQRMAYQPKYGNDYLEKFFPGYPGNLDWHAFLCAPRDQWRSVFFQGDEPFAIHNMHPDRPLLQGRLPGLHPRCFLRHTVNTPHPVFSELSLKLDTVWFFPEELLALLIWRGGMQVADDEAEQISHVLLGYELRGQAPKDEADYARALERRLGSSDALLNNFNTGDLIPAGHLCAMELLMDMALADDRKGEFEKNLEAKVQAITTMVDEKLEEALIETETRMAEMEAPPEARVDPRKLLAAQPAPDADIQALNAKLESILPGITAGNVRQIDWKRFSFEALDQIFHAVENFSSTKEQAARELASAELAQVVEQIRNQMAGQGAGQFPESSRDLVGQSLQELQAPRNADPRPSPLPRLDAEAMGDQLDQVTPQVAAAMEHVRGLRATGEESDTLSEMEQRIQETLEGQRIEVRKGLRDAEKAFRESYSMAAHFMPEGLSPHVLPIKVVAASFLEAVAAGQPVAGRDWACIDLAGQNLDGIDLRDALLEQVDFRGASLRGADLRGAILARARLSGADLSGANLEQANIGAVLAADSRFCGANLKRAKLSKGNFTGTDFSDCDLEDVEALEVAFSRARFTRARLPGLILLDTSMTRTRFDQADLSGSVFLNCELIDVDCAQAVLTGCTFADVHLHGVRFDDATCVGCCFAATEPDKTVMNRLHFVGAVLDRSNFQGMVLHHADFSSARMENANFAGADLTGARLVNTQAISAQFRKAHLTEAVLDGINLMGGSLAKAHLYRTSFAGANLYQVDFLRAKILESDFTGANLTSTLIENWRPA